MPEQSSTKGPFIEAQHPNPEIARLHRRAHAWDYIAQGWRILVRIDNDMGIMSPDLPRAIMAEQMRDLALAEARKLEGRA